MRRMIGILSLLGLLVSSGGCGPALLVGLGAFSAGGYLVGKKVAHDQGDTSTEPVASTEPGTTDTPVVAPSLSHPRRATRR